MTRSSSKLYTAAEVRAMDRQLIDVVGIPAYTLMGRAAEAAFAVLRKSWPAARKVLVVCGGGNNGGDGYIVARLVKAAGLEARVAAVVDPAQLSGDARRACEECVAAGVPVEAFDSAGLSGIDVIVDAIFGIGLNRPPEGKVVDCIAAINACRVPVLALDIPSGLHADTGEAMGTAVRAAATICFIGLKVGCFTGEGSKYSGTVTLAELAAGDSKVH